ncbi:MAG: pilus assembly protein PilM [Verrucomicrobia bacterium]|nr:pilus assembly protein PilM [Verrucomicrobiota bacterium]
MSSQRIGVEIHPLGVRCARVSVTSKGIQVHQVAEAPFAEGTLFTALQAGALPDELASVLDVRQFRGRAVVVVVDHPSVFLSTFDLAEGFTDELSTGIKWYADQYVPYPVDQAAVDFHVQRSPYAGQVTVQLIAIENAVLAAVMELLPPKRVKVSQIDGVPHALSRLYRSLAAATKASGEAEAGQESPLEPAVLVHASGARGYVVVTCDGVVETMRNVRLSDGSVLALADKVRQTCLHYEVHHPTQSVRAVYVTPATLADGAVGSGSGKPADGILAALSGEMGLDVKVLDPTSHVTFAGGREAASAPAGWAERYALAIGAAC